MKFTDRIVSVIPVQDGGVLKYKNVLTGELYDWSQLSQAPHTTALGLDQAAAVDIRVRIGVTATVRGNDGR